MTWPIHFEDARRLSVSGRRCLRILNCVFWEPRVSSGEVLRPVFGEGNRLLNEVIAVRPLRWIGFVLRMLFSRPRFRSPHARAWYCWTKRCEGQAISLLRGMAKLVSALAPVDASSIAGWDPTNEDCWRLTTLTDISQSQSQWRDRR